MKILYAITKSNWGGAQRHVYDLATAMKAKGYETVAAVGGEGILKKRLEEAGIFTHSISALGRDVSVSRDTGSFRELFSIIKRHRPDVLHLHSPKAAGLGALAGRILRVPRITYTVHGWAFNESRPLYQRALIAAASWVTMLLCHDVILLSRREFRQTQKFPLVGKKISLVPLGIRQPVFMSIDGAKQFMAKQIGMSFSDFSRRTIVGTVAELHRNKGLSYLIDAAVSVRASHPNALFLIVSDGEERANLEAQIEKLGLKETVYLAGYVENASEYLKSFTLSVLPSVKEGLPYTILEAGCASLPVVATMVGGIPEIIDDMKSGILVQPKKPAELAHAITFMLEHPDERRAYGNALHEKVTRDFSLEKMIGETEKIYLRK